ncbi:hypothetical protein [Flavobacterium wongokense]|uniref:hypothetical protein n=1 Tax=Flavobacterium wongokense TaxID=2910674 RepID=UPI001F338F02|nr:hypothetical protein [Flavobacterium sp. WG47]MCF6133263.1 hypothetical protein [Flavobacterium sp. WG47]
MKWYRQAFNQLPLKKALLFFPLFFLTMLAFSYYGMRKENRTNYAFAITHVEENINKHVRVGNDTIEFGFGNFSSFKADIQKGDSLVKKAFSKTLFIYRKDPISNKYTEHLRMSANGIFPIEWQ